jgi:mRNA interferase MazF
MNPGDVVLVRIPGAGGSPAKLRPALILAPLPGPYQRIFLCGISTQLGNLVPDWDELIQPSEADFPQSGLHRASAIRLSYLRAVTPGEVAGAIGTIDSARLARLLERLADHLQP